MSVTIATDRAHWRGSDTFAIVPRSCLDAIKPVVRRLKEAGGTECSVALSEAVFTRLATFASSDGSCHPYIASIAEALDVSERAVRRAITVLCQAGIVEKKARLDKGRKIGNVYELRLPPVDGTVHDPPDGPDSSVRSADRTLLSGPKNKTIQEQDQLEIAGPRTEASTPAAPRPGRANPPWDALAEVVGWQPTTRTERTRFGKATREVTEALTAESPERDWSPENVAAAIRARAARYRRQWPTAELTPESLLKHWARFGPGRRGSGTVSKRYEEMTDEEFRRTYPQLSEQEKLEAEDARARHPRSAGRD